MKDQVREAFSRRAFQYDAVVDIHADVAQTLIERIPKKNYHNIVELGCGSGLLSQHLLMLSPQANFTLIDFAKNMLEVCQAKFSQYQNIFYHCEDITNFNMDLEIDLLTSSMCLHWLEDLATFFVKLKKNLKSGCEMHFAILGEGSLGEWKTLCEKFASRTPTLNFPTLASMQAMFPKGQFQLEKKMKRYQNGLQFLSTLKNFGGGTSPSGHQPFSVKEMKTLLQQFDIENSPITYDIIYGRIIL